jgi:hypothetical protein
MRVGKIAAFLLVVGEAQPPKAATSKCAAMCDSQNAEGEKCGGSKNLNSWAGLCIGFF